jgi:hypothetical protein
LLDKSRFSSPLARKLTLETIVIEPPSLEEWENNKVFMPNPIADKYDRYVLTKNNVMYICGIFGHDHWTTFKKLTRYFDPIVYNLTDDLSLAINFHESNIDPINLYYDKKLFNDKYSNYIVPFYHFHCNR